MNGKSKSSSVSGSQLPDEESFGLINHSFLTTFLRENILILAFVILGVIFLVIGVFTLNSKSEDSGVIFEERAGSAQGKIKVDVGGAVVKSGVYDLDSDARIQDALILAGGLSSLADREWVAKNLNLAAKLTDGAKIYIPQKNESRLGPTEQGYGRQAGTSDGKTGEKISLNNASAEELDKLSGVGPVTAQKI
ncbi:MAG: helix-hairpin-helix domain-containing protein, partial [bacterium]|nr:helix-hairpin-helix domain-containing protein [bacterium]